MFYISYLAVLSICILIFLGVLDFKNKNKTEWLMYLFLFFSICLINSFCVYNNVWPAFHQSDEEYFYKSALYVIDLVEGGASLNEALVNYTWNYKYYGFIVFDGLSIIGAANTPEAHKISITIVLSSLYLIAIRLCILKGYFDRVSLRLVVIPIMLYLSLLNYRDGLISIVCFFMLLSLINKKFLTFFVYLTFLYFLRVEFIFIMLISTFSSLFISFFKRNALLNASFLLAVLVVLILFNNKESFNVSNYVLLPLSFNGVSIFQEIFLFFEGLHYYQDFFLVFMLGVIISFPLFVLKTVFIYYLMYGFNSVNYKDKFIVNFIVHFFLISMFIYTFMLEGMQDRIKLSFTFLLALLFNMVYKDLFSDRRFKYVLCISFVLSFIIAIRNVRWIY
ncbi:hypothetical protein D0907_14775 [Pseudoalteromonas lipolytica]|uniref:Uncharacterized protein n=1 Tax=Pseudoalteromonas lipolytica TaxID=570156 RepID=A0AAD0WDI6_9GAMM|nr:hypothetical protein [Pseudoalteromonas donghaensis]AXV66460.1 hypothetical protein D0907_14775 [Pseudoalteromonas donghaensis]